MNFRIPQRERPLGILFLALLTAGGCASDLNHDGNRVRGVALSSRFSPNGGCTLAITDALAGAMTSVLVQAYSFTSVPIAQAVITAHKRGVKVRVILDRSQFRGRGCVADRLVQEGIPTRIDTKHRLAHNKVMVIDGATVVTGSFNFTKAAEESNAENLLLIRSASLAAIYTKNWEEHWSHSVPYSMTTRSATKMEKPKPMHSVAPREVCDE